MKLKTTPRDRKRYRNFMTGVDDGDGIDTKWLMDFAMNLCDDVEALLAERGDPEGDRKVIGRP